MNNGYLTARRDACMMWLRANRAVLVMIVIVTLIALVPLYGILFPSVVDLAEHILVSKLLWEKLSGVSHLNLEISWFLGYRLFPILMLIVISFCKLFGISLIYLPKIVTVALISIHAIVIVTILSAVLKNKSWGNCAFAICFALPAVVCMYSAAWFLGLVNYTMAITLLIPAIFLTERFLCSGELMDGCLLLLTVALAYIAHPFAPAFWLLWCLCRAIASIVTRGIFVEWKRIVLLGAILFPIVLYHVLWTAGTALAPSTHSVLTQSPFVSVHDWYFSRLHNLLNGNYLKADDAADSRFFGLVALGLILSSTIFALRSAEKPHLRKVALTSFFLLVVSSWINEKLFPVPGGVWLAYDIRFSSTAYAICLAVAGTIFIRSLPVATDKSLQKTIFAVLALIALVASVQHLIGVRRAYQRFDIQARKYVERILNNEQPAGIYLPHTPWHPDGTYLNHYICLKQPDCISKGTTFGTGYAEGLFPVTLRSPKRAELKSGPAGSPTVAQLFSGDKGNGKGQLNWPRGIAVDDQGNILVADTNNGRIQRFSPAGVFLSSFGNPGVREGEFKDPSGLAVDRQGNIYVADFSNHRIQKFKSDGSFIAQWKGPDEVFAPHDLAFGANDSVYVADEGGARVIKFDSDGKIVGVWGARGDGDGQFNQLTAIAVDQKNKRMYLADPRNRRIVVLDTNGKFIANWFVEVWRQIENAWYLQSVIVDSNANRVYATGMQTPEVLVFDLKGARIASLKTDPPERLAGASAMALSRDKLYVLNTFAALVSVIDLRSQVPVTMSRYGAPSSQNKTR